eukprot:1672585-Ditylum_brightwellii.AAC.1
MDIYSEPAADQGQLQDLVKKQAMEENECLYEELHSIKGLIKHLKEKMLFKKSSLRGQSKSKSPCHHNTSNHKGNVNQDKSSSDSNNINARK